MNFQKLKFYTEWCSFAFFNERLFHSFVQENLLQIFGVWSAWCTEWFWIANLVEKMWHKESSHKFRELSYIWNYKVRFQRRLLLLHIFKFVISCWNKTLNYLIVLVLKVHENWAGASWPKSPWRSSFQKWLPFWWWAIDSMCRAYEYTLLWCIYWFCFQMLNCCNYKITWHGKNVPKYLQPFKFNWFSGLFILYFYKILK